MLSKFISTQIRTYLELIRKLNTGTLLSNIRSFSWKSYYKETKRKLEDLTGTNYNLALFHLNSGNIQDAIMRFKITSYMDKEKSYSDISYYIGLCYYSILKNEKAKHYLSLYLTNPKASKKEEAVFLLNVIDNNMDKIENIPYSLISLYHNQLYAKYGSEDSSTSYQKLQESLLFQLESHVNLHNKKNAILDLGCRTGKSGSMLRKLNRESFIEGVDASKSMIENARKSTFEGKESYTSIVNSTIHSYIESQAEKKKFDIIVANDSLNTHTDILTALIHLKSLLAPDGKLAISLRLTSHPKFNLNHLAYRFSFNINYIKEAIKKAKLKIISETDVSFQDEDNGVILIISN